MSEPSERLKKYEKERQERAESLPGRGAELREQLQKLGVTAVNAEYSGSSDSGQIDSVSFEPGTIKVPGKLENDVETLFYDVLETRYAGWENNDGASGTFDWDLTKNTDEAFKHEHIEYYTESNSYEHEGFGK